MNAGLQTAAESGPAPVADGVVVIAPRPRPVEVPHRRRTGNPHYSRFVALMKILLPSIAVAMVALVVVWPRLTAPDERFRMGSSSLALETVQSLSMINARYFGTDSENRPFTVTAETATESSSGRRAMVLQTPKADLSLKDGSWVVIGSDTGHYDHDGNLLDLVGDVNLFHDGGYELHTATARIDLKAGMASGDDPVQGQGPFGRLQAEGFRLYDRGERVVFTGKARVLFAPHKGPEGP
ncbi:MAG: LPS export ABC transporter periplasmic protein LptC [Alphaproteobacteria bacterium]